MVDDWDDTVFQTHDSKFEPWQSVAEHATSRSRRLPTILTFTRGWGKNIFCFFQTAETGNWTSNSGVKGSGANHYPRAPAPDTEVHPSSQQTQEPLLNLCCLKVGPPSSTLSQHLNNRGSTSRGTVLQANRQELIVFHISSYCLLPMHASIINPGQYTFPY